jgi:hypothetical protein
MAELANHIVKHPYDHVPFQWIIDQVERDWVVPESCGQDTLAPMSSPVRRRRPAPNIRISSPSGKTVEPRPRHSHPERSQSRVRQVTVKARTVALPTVHCREALCVGGLSLVQKTDGPVYVRPLSFRASPWPISPVAPLRSFDEPRLTSFVFRASDLCAAP